VDHAVAASDKARSMIAAWRSSAEPFVAFCDSDLSLPSDAVSQCMSGFDDDTVGAVFAHCLVDSPGALGRISMLTLTADAFAFLIGCSRLGAVPFLEGGLMILRRSAVERAGGIEMIASALGDDTRLGRQLRLAGFELRLAPFYVVHRSGVEGAVEWLSRYRRWLACHRCEVTVGFWSELLLNPTVAPLIALAAGASRWMWALASASVLLRVLITIFVDRGLLRRHGISLGWWSCLRPIGDFLHFCVCVSVVAYPWITWRGIHYAVRARGDMVRITDPANAGTESEMMAETGAV
jgi:GT2 family glycosyltransferase